MAGVPSAAIARSASATCVRIGCLAPLDVDLRDVRAVGRRDLGEAVAERADADRQHRVAGRQEVDDRRLERAGARAVRIRMSLRVANAVWRRPVTRVISSRNSGPRWLTIWRAPASRTASGRGVGPGMRRLIGTSVTRSDRWTVMVRAVRIIWRMPARRTASPSRHSAQQALDLSGTAAHAPLAARMRPQTLDEFVGQEHLVGERRRAAPHDRARPPRVDGPVGPAGHRARRRSRGCWPRRSTRRSRRCRR